MAGASASDLGKKPFRVPDQSTADTLAAVVVRDGKLEEESFTFGSLRHREPLAAATHRSDLS